MPDPTLGPGYEAQTLGMGPVKCNPLLDWLGVECYDIPVLGSSQPVPILPSDPATVLPKVPLSPEEVLAQIRASRPSQIDHPDKDLVTENDLAIRASNRLHDPSFLERAESEIKNAISTVGEAFASGVRSTATTAAEAAVSGAESSGSLVGGAIAGARTIASAVGDSVQAATVGALGGVLLVTAAGIAIYAVVRR